MIHTLAQPELNSETSRPAETAAWRDGLPTLSNEALTLRELRLSDAARLVEALNSEEVTRFVAPPPSSMTGFERFIAWTHVERAAGRFACFGVVPAGCDQAIGIVQVRRLGPTFDTAEWGAALAADFWGRGVFPAAAREIFGFTFRTLGARRLEARAAVENARGNAAMQKLGATRERVLPHSFLRDGVYHDQVMWTVVRPGS